MACCAAALQAGFRYNSNAFRGNHAGGKGPQTGRDWDTRRVSLYNGNPLENMIILGEDGIMKRLKLMLALMAVLGLAGCNTVQGVGKDIQAGGKAVEKSAR